MKLCLGTVQFGMDYGVFEEKKKEPAYCVECLDYATQNGIHAIDTAMAYGTAEDVVGKFLKKKTIPRNRLFISTKLRPNILDDHYEKEYQSIIKQELEKSLKRLGTDYIDAYFLHSSRYAFRPEILEALAVVKRDGLAKETGVSVYDPEEAFACFKNKDVGYIQAPFSIFDHRMKKKNVFSSLPDNCKIDTRTAFVKGLIRLKQEEVPEYLSKAKPILEKLDKICNETGYTRIELAIGYVKRENKISHLVFGIRNMEQLKEDIESFNKDISSEIFEKIDKEFADIDTDIVVPSLWKK